MFSILNVLDRDPALVERLLEGLLRGAVLTPAQQEFSDIIETYLGGDESVYPRLCKLAAITSDADTIADVTPSSVALEIDGYGAIWNSRNSFGERFERGGFDKGLKYLPATQLPILYDHETAIGAWTSITNDDYGLRCKGLIYPNTPLGADVAQAVDCKLLDRLSICFVDPDRDPFSGRRPRTVGADAVLVETSVVDSPSQPEAEILSARWVRTIEAHPDLALAA